MVAQKREKKKQYKSCNFCYYLLCPCKCSFGSSRKQDRGLNHNYQKFQKDLAEFNEERADPTILAKCVGLAERRKILAEKSEMINFLMLKKQAIIDARNSKPVEKQDP